MKLLQRLFTRKPVDPNEGAWAGYYGKLDQWDGRTLTEESDYGAWINKVRRSHRDIEDYPQ